ncbi:CPBP family intramembrane glutamic endopeptidase [Leucobacter luti]|uniref:CPBP family intramembrane glutamic endopeptidase n=1 Tax=Leucobacter luti TaxID=340320 RepID=UPI001C6877B8|nr:CPBP family intramembrane glutamic endopeptidase [Leucobacter luti]QYM74737.1 CPBP family intramembrane metalloprotease [Leucobacter luti]
MNVRTLPAPTAGMLRAQRPTGIIMAFVVLFIALLAQTIPTVGITIADSLTGASPAGAASEPALAETHERVRLSVLLLSFALTIGVLWLWVRAKEQRPFASLGFESRRGALRVALRGAGIGLAMLIVCLLVPLALGEVQLSWAAPSGAGATFIFLMLAAFLVQGSAEEILLRGFLTQAVARRWGLVAAVITQAVVFAAIHGANAGVGVLPVVNLLLFASFASFLSLADGSLWGICAMHGVWNWAQGNLFGVAVSGNAAADSLFTITSSGSTNELISGGSFGLEGSLVTTAVYLIGVAIAWRVWRARRGHDETTPV